MFALLKLSILAATAAATVLGGAGYGNQTYDYIIVGGGTAGTALATRLSQALSNSSILLIEAGPAAPEALGINVPGMVGSTQGGQYDWNLTTIPQADLDNRSIALSRGKVLGGSSAMNYMLWNRASAPEYDSWETLGNPGWNWSTILAGMVKSENFTGINTTDYGHIGRGTKGPIHNVIGRYRTEQVSAWIPTMENLGLVHNLESLGGDPLGVMLQPASANPDNYTRSYSANSYLPRAKPNLDVLLSTRVAKVNFVVGSRRKTRASLSTFQNRDVSSEDEQIATGVTLQDGTVINARKEVIVSAGSLQSPGLLELSGIGQKEVLDTAGIEQIIDLPGVGENLQDHNGLHMEYQLKPNYTSLDIFAYNATYAAEQLALWEEDKLSRYDTTLGNTAFLNWRQILGNDTALVDLAQQATGNSPSVIDQTKLAFFSDYSIPQIEIALSDGAVGGNYPLEVGDPDYGIDFIAFAVIGMRPLSRGSVHILSANISQDPVIDPQYGSNPYDLQALIDAAKYARKIAQTQPIADFLVGEYSPGLDAVNTDEEWAEFARETMITIYHYSGTCAMLPVEDGGVVDPRLRVWGTKNLRVVDASIIPVLIASHTQTVTYGIAERAAEIIIEDYYDS